MSTSTDPVRQMMAAANPAPIDAEPPAEILAAPVLLDVIDERSGEMAHSTKTHKQQAPRLPRRREWTWAFAGGLIVVLLTIGVAILVIDGGGSDVVSEPSVTTVEQPGTTTPSTQAPTTAVPGSSTSSVTQPEPAGQAPSSWERIDSGDMVAGAIATGPTGSVAVGIESDGPYSERNTAWFSADGETWQPLPIPGGQDVAFGEPGFVVCCRQTGHLAVTAASFSPDGITWVTPANDFDGTERLLPGTYERMEAVTYGNGVFVAAGEVIDFGTQIEAVRFGVWSSDDGQTWALQQELAQNGMGPGSPVDVTFGSRGFVALGGGQIWHSPNGDIWSLVAFDPETLYDRVEYGDAGYVAIGFPAEAERDSDSIWHSVDGITWAKVASIPRATHDVVFGGGTYVVTGWAEEMAAAWHSIDGLDWNRLDLDPDAFTNAWIRSVGYTNGKFILLGEEIDPGNPAHGLIWIGR